MKWNFGINKFNYNLNHYNKETFIYLYIVFITTYHSRNLITFIFATTLNMFFKQEQQKSFFRKLRSRVEDVGTSVFCVFFGSTGGIVEVVMVKGYVYVCYDKM